MAAPSPFSPSMKAVTAPSPSERTTARTGIESVLYHAALQPLKSAAAVRKSAAQHERDATGLRAPPAIAAPPVALALVLLPERTRAPPARPGLPVLSIGHNAWKSSAVLLVICGDKAMPCLRCHVEACAVELPSLSVHLPIPQHRFTGVSVPLLWLVPQRFEVGRHKLDCNITREQAWPSSSSSQITEVAAVTDTATRGVCSV